MKLRNLFNFRSTKTTDNLSEAEKSFIAGLDLDIAMDGDVLRETTYFTCIKILSESVAKVPCYLLKEEKKGDRRAKEHYLYEKLCLRPNPYMTAIDFWKAIESNRHHNGRGCALIERDSKERILNLYPIEFKRLVIDDEGIKGGVNSILVEYTLVGDFKLQYCLYDDVLDLKAFTLDGVHSKANKNLINETITTNKKSQHYLNRLFDNGLTNKIVVQLTSDIKDEKELKKIQAKFDRLFSTNGRTLTVPAGYNVQGLNLSLSDAQFEQLRRMSISQIASSFGIKMFQLNDLKDTNNNSLEQQQLSFLIDTLLILFEGNEQELDWKLLTPLERLQGYKFRFNTNVVLRPDSKSQAEILTKYVSGAIYTPNYARRQLGLQDIDGGDDLIVNAGVLKIKNIGKEVSNNE